MVFRYNIDIDQLKSVKSDKPCKMKRSIKRNVKVLTSENKRLLRLLGFKLFKK